MSNQERARRSWRVSYAWSRFQITKKGVSVYGMESANEVLGEKRELAQVTVWWKQGSGVMTGGDRLGNSAVRGV